MKYPGPAQVYAYSYGEPNMIPEQTAPSMAGTLAHGQPGNYGTYKNQQYYIPSQKGPCSG